MFGYTFQWKQALARLPQMLDGAAVTLQIALLSMALASPLWWSTALVRGPRALGAWHDRVSKSGLPGHA